jgi:phenylalanyl-tRNA synthetase beta chain
MLLSLNWLKKYVKLDEKISPEEIAEMLSTSGFEIEEVKYTGCNIDGIVIGKVEKCEAHTNSDHLSVCQVDIGEKEPVQIVCGAPNVAQGQTVPVATVGTKFPGGFKIKKSKLRGEVSMGMICSERELGISNEHEGIMTLETNLSTGTKIEKYFTEIDVIFDISITPNRADCFNHLAIARELSVMFNAEFSMPEMEVSENGEKSEDLISINLEENSGCERFIARVIKNVEVKESPKWLQNALLAIDQRPINNLVDISNYIMFELGQPLHFYDYDKVTGKKLNIRSAKKDEKVITLDDKEISLTENEIVIEDAEKFACLGGVMGGRDTEVSDDTKNVLIEAAVWTPSRIMKTNREMGMNSEASYRFGKGVDFNGPLLAQKRAAQLIQEIAGGEISQGLVDVATKTVEPWTVSFRYERCHSILGHKISEEKIDEIFESLNLTKLNNTDWLIPTYRQDLTREIDLIEEVARIYGLDNIPSKKSMNLHYDIKINEKDAFLSEFRQILSSMGLQEIHTNSMVSSKEYRFYNSLDPVEILNPLTDDADILRTTLIPSVLKSMDHNVKRQQPNCSFFEINKDYKIKKKKPVETEKLVVALTGTLAEKNWANSSKNIDFYDIKGFAEAIFERLGIENYTFEISEKDILSEESVSIKYKNNEIGFFGKIDSSVKKHMKLGFDSYVLELNIKDLFQNKKGTISYKEISKFPMVERDIAVMVKKNISVHKLFNSIKEFCGELLVSLSVIDVYSDKSFEKDEHSIAFKLFFGANKTLTDEEITPLFEGSIKLLSENFSAYLREG